MRNRPVPPARPKFSAAPTELVLKLRQQGLSPSQIVQTLQHEGYEVDQIHDAINQADVKEGIEAVPLQQKGDNMQEEMQGMPPTSYDEQPQDQFGGQQWQQPPQPPGGIGAPQQQGGSDDERINEIAEAIIDEKWAALTENITKILEWKEATDMKISKFEQQLNDMKENFDRLHEGILERVGEYDKNITSVGTELKALEKVFREILPGFMENVNELSRITQTVKKVGLKR